MTTTLEETARSADARVTAPKQVRPTAPAAPTRPDGDPSGSGDDYTLDMALESWRRRRFAEWSRA